MKELNFSQGLEKPEKEKMRYFVVQTEISDPIIKNETRTIKKYLAAADEAEARERIKLLVINDFSLDENEVDEKKIEVREINEKEYWQITTKIKKSAESAHK